MKGMSNKGVSGMLSGILGLLVILMVTAEIQGQNRGEIDAIRRSATLTPENLQVLSIFITRQFELMEFADDVTGLNEPLIDLENASTSTSSNIQTRQQYLAEFARITKENYLGLYQKGVDLARQEAPEQKELGENMKLAAATTLVISGHPTLIEDLKQLLDDESAMVRACAVKGFTRDSMQELLTQEDATSALAGILSSLDVQLTTETSAEMIMYAATVASLVDNAQSVALLKKCVARRVELYKSWEVNRESADVKILAQVFKVAQLKVAGNDRRGATDLLRSATELYTAAYHRYRMGKAFLTADNKTAPLLTEENQQALKSLLIVMEKEFIQICNQPARAQAIFIALQDAGETGLPNAFDSLMGLAGKVQQAFSIYDGWAMPGELPAPSAEIVQKALTLQKIKANVIKD